MSHALWTSHLLAPAVEIKAEGESKWMTDGGEFAELIRRRDWADTHLEAIGSWPQLIIEGPPVLVEPDAALALHMMLHELSTNAARYGALSTSNGRIKRKGFGTNVLQYIARYELDGQTELRFEPEGLGCTIRFPWTAGATVERGEGK